MEGSSKGRSCPSPQVPAQNTPKPDPQSLLYHFILVSSSEKAGPAKPLDRPGTDTCNWRRAAALAGPQRKPACAFLVGSEPGGELSPRASSANGQQHTAYVPCYRVGRQWPSPPSRSRTGGPGGPVTFLCREVGTRVQGEQQAAQPGLLLSPSPAAHGEEHGPLGCLQQAPLLFLQT